jgi:hypothetical protein
VNSCRPSPSPVFGQVQDRDGDYRGVISIGIGLKTWAFFVGVGYCFLDRYKLGGVGNLGEKARMAKEEAVVDPTRKSILPSRIFFRQFRSRLFLTLGVCRRSSHRSTCLAAPLLRRNRRHLVHGRCNVGPSSFIPSPSYGDHIA